MLSEKEGSSSNNNNNQSKSPSEQPQPQVRIIWSLLLECLKCTLNILNAHVEFSSKIMSMIIANQNLMSANVASAVSSSQMANNGGPLTLTSYKQQQIGGQWQSQSSSRPNHQPIQAPNNRSFYQPRMPFASKFENQSRDVQLIGMGPSWRHQHHQQQHGGGTTSYRNSSSNTSMSSGSYRNRYTPDSGYGSNSNYTGGKASFKDGQYRQFSNSNSGGGGDSFDAGLMYMSSVPVPFNSSGVS